MCEYNEELAVGNDISMDHTENRITVGINVKSSSDLPQSAYDIASFVNILREQIASEFSIDIQACINTKETYKEDKSFIGFMADDTAEIAVEDDFVDEALGMARIQREKGRR